MRLLVAHRPGTLTANRESVMVSFAAPTSVRMRAASRTLSAGTIALPGVGGLLFPLPLVALLGVQGTWAG